MPLSAWIKRHRRQSAVPDLPVNLNTHLFSTQNTWVVIGLPDTEAQYGASLQRQGVACQFTWRQYIEAITFVHKEYPKGHLLHGAKRVDAIDGVLRADLYPSYGLRKKQISNLTHRRGPKVWFGASSDDFLRAADATFSEGGLLMVMTHFEKEGRGFEFNDGFLSIGEISKRRTPSGTGLLDAVCCEAGEVLQDMKRAMGLGIWIHAPTVLIGLTGQLIYGVEFLTSIVESPKTLLGHIQFTHKRLKEMGLPTGVDQKLKKGLDDHGE